MSGFGLLCFQATLRATVANTCGLNLSHRVFRGQHGNPEPQRELPTTCTAVPETVYRTTPWSHLPPLGFGPSSATHPNPGIFPSRPALPRELVLLHSLGQGSLASKRECTAPKNWHPRAEPGLLLPSFQGSRVMLQLGSQASQRDTSFSFLCHHVNHILAFPGLPVRPSHDSAWYLLLYVVMPDCECS